MGEEATKVAVPESVLKKQKREEEWALAKKQELSATKKKNAENRKLIFNRAKQYAKEYQEQVCIVLNCISHPFYFIFNVGFLNALFVGEFVGNGTCTIEARGKVEGWILC